MAAEYHKKLITTLYVLLIVGFSVVSGLPYFTDNQNSKVFTIPFRVVILGISLAVIFLSIYKKKFKIRFVGIIFSIFWLFYAAKVLYVFQNTSNAVNHNLQEILQRIFFICFIPAMAVLITENKNINYFKIFRLAYIILFGVLFVDLLSGLQTDHAGRSVGIHSIWSISFGHLGVSLSLLSLYYLLFIRNNKIDTLITVIGFCIGVIIMYASTTRSPFIALLIGSLYLLFAKRYYKIILGFLVSVFIGLLFIFILEPKSENGSFNLFERIYLTLSEGDTSGRTPLYTEAMQLFEKNPIFGEAIFLENGMYPHNIYLEVLMSVGIVGFILILIIHFKVFSQIWNLGYTRVQPQKIWVCVLFIQYFVLSLTSYNLYGNPELWYFTAMVLASANTNNEEA